jgi:UDP-N-acetylglucosamine 2-epimerase (non-hydrolysing)
MIGVVIGTRPELIKCLPLLNISDKYIPIFVLQHSDILKDYITSTSLVINISSDGPDRLNNIIASICLSHIFKDNTFQALLVQGDTAVAFGAAIVSLQLKIPLIHLEAGLRTYNNEHPWPEEGYRRMIDCIANIALCPSINSARNLMNERFSGEIHVVGNTSIDVIASYNLTPCIGNTVLVTLHRRENWAHIDAFFEAIERLANVYLELEFILPVHPNPSIQETARKIFKKVHLINPLKHYDLCKVLESCNTVISDSGGIQEEASYLGKLVYCCRLTTEREELRDDYLVMTPTPDSLLTSFKPQTCLLSSATVYGKGDTALSVHTILAKKFDIE